MLLSIVGALTALVFATFVECSSIPPPFYKSHHLYISSPESDINTLWVSFDLKTGFVYVLNYKNTKPVIKTDLEFDNNELTYPLNRDVKNPSQKWYLGVDNNNQLRFYQNMPEKATLFWSERYNKSNYIQIHDIGCDAGSGTVFHLTPRDETSYNVTVWVPATGKFYEGDYLVNIRIKDGKSQIVLKYLVSLLTFF